MTWKFFFCSLLFLSLESPSLLIQILFLLIPSFVLCARCVGKEEEERQLAGHLCFFSHTLLPKKKLLACLVQEREIDLRRNVLKCLPSEFAMWLPCHVFLYWQITLPFFFSVLPDFSRNLEAKSILMSTLKNCFHLRAIYTVVVKKK